MSEFWRLSACELARRVGTRGLSAREVALDALARLDAVNPAVNAVVDHRPDDVLAQADAVDARLARGEEPGLLAGVPVTVKVNADQAGYATTNGVALQRDLVPAADNPVVDNLKRAGAVILGRTNAPAFSYRWFTSNLLHGATRNPRDPGLTPGGSSGGAASALASGIGALAHGTDIAGSIRYPAYACGVHGLRPSFGRVPAYNASSPERTIGPQLTAVSGPLARTIADLRLGLAAMSVRSPLDPWWVPAPLEGPDRPRRAAFCVRPNGLAVDSAVAAAIMDGANRLQRAGWSVEEIADTPPLQEAGDLQIKLWFGEGYEGMVASAEREGDPGALRVLAGQRQVARSVDLASFSAALTRRATLIRQWTLFLEDYPVLLLPISGELPFADDLDLVDETSFARVWRAQMTQIGLPFLGLPALAISTGLHGTTPVGVQIVAGRFREDLCLLAGEAIEAGGTPPSPVDPRRAPG